MNNSEHNIVTVKFILTVLYKCKHYKHYEMWLVQPSDSVFAKIVQYYIDFIFIEIINYYVLYSTIFIGNG